MQFLDHTEKLAFVIETNELKLFKTINAVSFENGVR